MNNKAQLKWIRTNALNRDFMELVVQLDKDLKIRDGDDHEFYAQFNKVEKINYVIVAYHDQEAVGCGAIKLFDDKTMEIKRMYVSPDFRSSGIATSILQELELWAKELDCYRCILETGFNQPEAIRLYQKNNYEVISNFGPYKNVKTSICFGKNL